MCLTFFRLLPSPELDFLLCFNREEASARPTLPLAPYEEDANIIGGRDMLSKGSWLGVNIKTGILVILTNFDTPVRFFGLSRGKLVYSILSSHFIPKGKSSDQAIQQFLREELKRRLEYSPFNLVILNIKTEKMFYICSQLPQTEPRVLEKAKPYGLCNTDIDTIWPKTAHGLSLFNSILAQSQKQEGKQEGTKGIFEQMYGLCKDKKSFSERKEDEASIFVEPYFDSVSQKQRMTKSSLMCRIQSTAKGKQITLREISYRQDQTEHVVDAQYTLGEKE